MIDNLLKQAGEVYSRRGKADAWNEERSILKQCLTLAITELEDLYELLDIIDIGSSAIIVKAKDKSLGVHRALKFPRPYLEKDRIVKIFRGEIENLLALNHENIMKIYHQGSIEVEDVTYPFFVMEYIDGITDLDKHLSEKTLDGDSLIDILVSIMSAVDHMHKRGIIHCDLKPANIMMAPRGSGDRLVPLVSDLGYSKNFITDIDPKRLTIITFTEKYAHPELKKLVEEQRGDPNARIGEIQASSLKPVFDQYALGISVLEFIDERPNCITGLSDYQRRYLRLIGARLLDGRLPPPSAGGVLGLTASVMQEIRYGSISQCERDLEALASRYSLDTAIPELNPYLEATIQIPGKSRVPFTERIREIVQHPSFNRLGQIAQLGLLNLVYPGANHSRFEHCLGTFANTCEYVRALYYDEWNPLFRSIMTEADVETVLLASLLHDLGQFPLAHDIEDVLRRYFRHEEFSREILADEIRPASAERPLKEVIESSWSVSVEDIIRLIVGESHGKLTFKEKILKSIFDGPIDADKLDYLTRDSIHLGLPYGTALDFDRLMKCLTVAYDLAGTDEYVGIGVMEKGRVSVEAVAFARYAMFNSAYWQHTARAIKAMIRYAVTHAIQSDEDARAFRDHIFEELKLEAQAAFVQAPEADASNQVNESARRILKWLGEKGGAEVQAMISALLNRQLYKRLHEVPYSEGNRGLYERLQAILTRGAEDVENCRSALESKIIEQVSRVHQQADCCILESRPLVLIDYPWRDWSASRLRYVRQIENRYVVASLNDSPIWKTLHEEFNRLAGKIRVFAHPKAHDCLRTLSEASVSQALNRVVNDAYEAAL